MKKLFTIIISSIFIVFLSCSKEVPTEPSNNTPVIKSISATPSSIKIGETVNLSCIATDEDGDPLTYIWFSNFGTFPNGNSGASVNWNAPNIDSTYTIITTVSDVKEIIKDSIIISVSSNNSISGTVYKRNTIIPISNALVEIGDMSSITDINGSYMIKNIPSGEVTVKVTKIDYEKYEHKLIISSTKAVKHDVYLTGAILLSGKIFDKETNEAISDVRVTINDQTDSTDANGYFQITNLAPGRYNISAKKNMYFSFNDNIELRGSNYTFDISIEYKFSNLSGVVKNSYTSELLQNITVTIDGKEVVTDKNGYYFLSGLTKGTHTLTAMGNSKWYHIYNKKINLDKKDITYEISLENNYCPNTPIVAYHGKNYNTVQINNQCWLKENLNIGTMINGNSNQTDNDIIEKYCYNNDSTNCKTYGGIYQWDEAMQYLKVHGERGICPKGWHVPTKTEWEILQSNINNEATKVIDAKAKMGHSYSNETGFSTLFSGYRYSNFDGFAGVGYFTYFWSSTLNSNNKINGTNIGYNKNTIDISTYPKNSGFSIRCIKN